METRSIEGEKGRGGEKIVLDLVSGYDSVVRHSVYAAISDHGIT
jgi:hypothetical protein